MVSLALDKGNQCLVFLRRKDFTGHRASSPEIHLGANGEQEGASGARPVGAPWERMAHKGEGRH